MGTSFDYVEVGGGTSGCVAAAKLVSTYNAKVLVLEEATSFGCIGSSMMMRSARKPAMGPVTEVEFHRRAASATALGVATSSSD